MIDEAASATPKNDGNDHLTGLDFPIVGLGASAGGLGALIQFFECLPDEPGMAFVVVMHLAPNNDSDVAGILGRATKLPVQQVTGSCEIRKNNIYIIPPAHTLLMTARQLELGDAQRHEGARVAIDLFFRSLADAHGDKAISIVLSGSGADGAVGIQRIKERGGLAMAQSPEEAEFDSMPREAIATGHIDIVLPVAEMPDRLVKLGLNAQALDAYTPTSGDSANIHRADAITPEQSEQALLAVMAKLHVRTSHDFSHYKRATVLRRVERRLQVNGIPNIPAYLKFLEAHPDETSGLLKDMLISVTDFYRDRLAFEALERGVIDSIVSSSKPDTPVRAWVAGCATGEEAYSLAILFAERFKQSKQISNVQIFASDIDEPALAYARDGIYPESIVVDVPPTRLREFFVKEPTNYRVSKTVRETILFSAQNVLQDPPFSRLDLISCRNLLIYLEREAQHAVFETFHFALNPGGFLFLGNSESAEAAGELFSVIDKKNRIYRANPAPRTHRRGLVATRWDRALTPGSFQSHARGSVAPPPLAYAEVHGALIAEHAPPSILVDQHYDIVHVTPTAGKFLHPPVGTPTHQVLSLIRTELRQDLRSVLYKATNAGGTADAHHRGLAIGQSYFNIHVTAKRVQAAGQPLILIMFHAVDATMDVGAGTATLIPAVVTELEDEIRLLKEQLQETIDDAETSTEELKTANEESQSMNEELRSATEELETSKEELQSINEELTTVNGELKSKVDEASRFNDDLQNFIAAFDVATIFVDTDVNIRRFSPKTRSLFSLINSDIGRSLFDINHKLYWNTIEKHVRAALDDDESSEHDIKDHEGRNYAARVSSFKTGDGVIDGAILTFVDVTVLRDAQTRMRESEARLSLIVKSTKDYAIVSMDTSGCIVSWNAGAETIFGYKEAEALGQSGEIFFISDESGTNAFHEEMHIALTQGRAEDERWHKRKGGEDVFCSGIMVSLFADDGSFEGFAKIARDYTQRQKLDRFKARRLLREKEVRQASQQANHLKDEFLAIMSHELKHPLNLISLNAELMERLPSVRGHGMMERALATIVKAVKSQATIIDDLLDLSRIKTGKLALNKRDFDAIPVMTSIMASAREVASAKDIALTWAAQGRVIYLCADVVRFEQIVWNLISNALKFTPAGGRVVVDLREEEAMVALTVRDSGPGMLKEDIPYVFDLFRQTDGRGGKPAEGLGVGMTLVKELTEAHDGGVEASSEGVGQGMLFRVCLPRSLGRDTRETPVSGAASSLSGVKLLLVDDSQEVLDALSALLETEGVDVTTATNGEDALTELAKEAFHVLISDLGMKGMSGFELIGVVRSMDEFRNLPAIALSGFGRKVDVDHAIHVGFDAHLAKPTSLDNLRKVVLQVLAPRGGAAPS